MSKKQATVPTVAQRSTRTQENAGRTKTEASLNASALAHLGWGMCEDRPARTAPGRAKFEQGFLDRADGDPVRAASLRAAYYKDLARQSVVARRKNREARENGTAA